ncbi:aminopeptidase N-like [Malaya genurostris]|uniref:aminopeptidase N-like n=1 Tax=Malaya genurostris TaxID=325434 RepID=UPI0026F3C951|nr:aminopeptidase N-like [Malaya genurostris]
MNRVVLVTLLITLTALDGLAKFLVNGSKDTSYRLPREVIPEHYDLEVHTHLNDDGKEFRFHGMVNITVRSRYNSIDITLHSKNLSIAENNISIRDLYHKRQVKIFAIAYDPRNDFLIIRTAGLFREGHRYRLSIPFEAELKADVIGYYRSSYLNSESGQRVWLSTTQFQAIHARRAFPCFDEPELKATFNVSLGHHRKYNALSNMPLIRSETSANQPNWIVDHFDKSVLMSSYLVGYSINDYSSVEASSNDRSTAVTVRSWTRKDATANLQYANEIAVKLIHLYEQNFNLQFPLPKLDFISIPDMLFAAMENWGLVTFTEAGLEYSPSAATIENQHFVASVVAHEIAHMWFGNLVTMRWWTDLWLNEGFARYTEFQAVDYLHPEWRSLDDIIIEDLQEIFKFDALNSSHAVSITIGNPEEIPQLFDSISYKKGSAIVRMMNMFLGDDVYHRGIARYLQRFKYGNAAQDDLWKALTEEASEAGSFPDFFDVKTIMDSWTLQTGYPVVTVERNYVNRTIAFRQMRFMYDGTIGDSACWWVPLTISTARQPNFDQTQPQDWLSCSRETIIVLPDPPCDNEWIIVNHKLAGLYKVQYDYDNYRLLAIQLKSSGFHAINPINRAQLIDDALDFSWSGIQDYSIAFSLLNYLPSESEYIPWKAALTNLDVLGRILENTSYHDTYQAYVSHLLTPLYSRLNVFQTKDTTSRLGQARLRKLVTDWACRMNIGDCVVSAVKLFDNWITNGTNSVPLNLRSTVYCTAIREGSQREWDFLWARYRDGNIASSERSAVAQGLSCTKDVELMGRLLYWSTGNTPVLRLEDTTVVFYTIAEQQDGKPVAKRFLFDNIDKMADYVNPETFESRLASHVKVLAQQITSKPDLVELAQFVTSKQTILAGNSLAIRQALELAHLNIQWMQNQLEEFVSYLKLLAMNGFNASVVEWF